MQQSCVVRRLSPRQTMVVFDLLGMYSHSAAVCQPGQHRHHRQNTGNAVIIGRVVTVETTLQ